MPAKNSKENKKISKKTLVLNKIKIIV